MLFQLTSNDKLQILTQHSVHQFFLKNIFVINYFLVGPLSKVVKKLLKIVTSLGASHELNTIFFLGTDFLGQFIVQNFERHIL